MNDPDTAVDILTKLSDRGITISLDDFGTGYSSLAYLQRLPVSELKIDRSFVQALSGETENATALFRSITALGTNLGLRIVAEGIETAEQLTAAQELGCHLGQGFRLSRPVPVAEFHDWLGQRPEDETAAAALRLVSLAPGPGWRRHVG
jgi:EAL domain-containing protein (putative c-di-GMP-specific phosphodiesterase class I)